MLLSAVSVLVVAQSSSEIPEGLMNNPVFSRVSYRNQENSQNLIHGIQQTKQVLPYNGTLASGQQTE